MNTNERTHKNWKLLAVLSGAVLILALSVLSLLRFGRPQWHRYIQKFQAHVRKSYTGKWVDWHEDGTRGEGILIDGKEEDTWIIWHRNGQKAYEGRYHKGKPVVEHMRWHPNGQQKCKATYATQTDGSVKLVEHLSWDDRGALVLSEENLAE